MARALVVTPSNDKETRITRSWGEAVLNLARAADPNSFPLDEHEAVRDRFESALTENPSISLVVFYGHGLDDGLLGHDRRPLLDRHNAALMAGKTLVAVACLSGTELGPALMQAGCQAFIGYTTYVWLWEEGGFLRRREDRESRERANALLAGANLGISQALIEGHTYAFSVEIGRDTYSRAYAEYQDREAAGELDAGIAKSRFLRNRNGLRLMTADEYAFL